MQATDEILRAGTANVMYAQSINLPDLSQLPPWAVVAFGISLAIIVAMGWLGERAGRKGTTQQASQATVAAVIVDPSALNAAAASVDGLTVAVSAGTVALRSHTAATDRMADKIDQLQDGVDALRTELIRSAARLG